MGDDPCGHVWVRKGRLIVTHHVLDEAAEGPCGESCDGDRECQPEPSRVRWVQTSPAPRRLCGEPAPDPRERRGCRQPVSEGFQSRRTPRESTHQAGRDEAEHDQREQPESHSARGLLHALVARPSKVAEHGECGPPQGAPGDVVGEEGWVVNVRHSGEAGDEHSKGCSQNPLARGNGAVFGEHPQVKRGRTHSRSEALFGFSPTSAKHRAVFLGARDLREQEPPDREPVVDDVGTRCEEQGGANARHDASCAANAGEDPGTHNRRCEGESS